MKKLIRLLCMGVILASVNVYADQDALMEMEISELVANATQIHPAGLYFLSIKLFNEQRVDEAVHWFYVGQLRYRFHLAAHPELDPSEDPALFASLQDVVGRPINEYAGANPDFWVAAIKKARDWDRQNDNGFTSKEKYMQAYEETLSGMDQLITHIEKSKEEIREQRRKNGLEN